MRSSNLRQKHLRDAHEFASMEIKELGEQVTDGFGIYLASE